MKVTVELPVLWADMDALGHVNNARYFTWFESARIALFEEVGVVASAPSEIGPILATTHCDFLQPVVYPATVRCEATVSKVGNTSFTIDYEVFRGDEIVARGSSVVVLVNYGTGEKVRVPDEVRGRLA